MIGGGHMAAPLTLTLTTYVMSQLLTCHMSFTLAAPRRGEWGGQGRVEKVSVHVLPGKETQLESRCERHKERENTFDGGRETLRFMLNVSCSTFYTRRFEVKYGIQLAVGCSSWALP